MDIHQYARALETVSIFLGDNGWSIVNPMLVEAMKKRKIIGLGYFMHDGTYYQIRLNGQ